MNTTRYSLVYKVTLLCFFISSSQMGYGQNYNTEIYNNGDDFININNFPDLACGTGGFVFTSDVNCQNTPNCFQDILDGIPLSDYHIMDIGETINLSIQTFSQTGSYEFSTVNIDHVSNLGTPQETTTPMIYSSPFCGGSFCSQIFNGSITPNSGSVNDLIQIRVSGVGSFILPLAVTGPVNVEVPALGTIITPQIPYLVLHDPPGDGSFSTFQENTTICRSTSTTYEDSDGTGFDAAVKAGVAGSVGIGIEQDFEFSVEFSNQFSITHTNQNTQEEEQCIETISEFNTSDLSSAVGDGADVFIGYGETLIWGLYDNVIYDGCNIDIKEGLTYYPDPNGTTTFVKTAKGIEADIDVQLAIANDTNNSTLVRGRAFNQAQVWQDVLAQNATNVANASENLGNYNFEGGTNSTFSEGVTTTQIKSMSYNVALENNTQITVVAEVGANGVTGGPEFTLTKNEGMTTSSSTNNGQIIAYTLTDDEDGDNDSEGLVDVFNVTAFKDPSYGTPIFKLNNGSRTSCPYEGAYRRDQPRLGFLSGSCPDNDGELLYVVDDNDFSTPTQLQFQLCNDSNESNDYQLSMSNNFNNAQVEAGGGNLTSGSAVVYFNEIAAGTCQNILVEIEGNGSATLDNHNLIFKLAPSCGSVPGGASNVEINEADIVRLNISFRPNAAYQETLYCGDADSACPPDYAGMNSLNGTLSSDFYYESPGIIESSQSINTNLNVIYDSGTSISLNPGFEIALGTIFEAYIDGCTPLSFENEEVEIAYRSTPEEAAEIEVRPDASIVKIYPNPVTDHTTIAIDNAWRGETQIRLINMLGRTIAIHSFEKMEDNSQIEFNTNDLPKGHYKVLISDGLQLATSSFVKM